MSEVKRYDMDGFMGGLVAHPDGAWYHMDDYDRVAAERDALLRREVLAKEQIDEHLSVVRDQRTKIDALQALLTAADEKNDTLSTAYLSAGVREHLLRLRVADLEGLLQMFIENTDDKDVIELAQHALKPAEGGGDEQG